MAPTHDREKALDLALAQIDKNFGKGSVMRLGQEAVNLSKSSRPARSPSISRWVLVGCPWSCRGDLRSESSGKTTVALHAVANAQAQGGIAAFIDAEHALDPDYAASQASIPTRCWCPSRTPASRPWKSLTC